MTGSAMASADELAFECPVGLNGLHVVPIGVPTFWISAALNPALPFLFLHTPST